MSTTQPTPGTGKTPAPKKVKSPRTNESKSQKFSRLATARTNKAVKAILQIANLGGSAYESTQDQRDKIGKALQTALTDTLANLNRVKPTNAPGFTL